MTRIAKSLGTPERQVNAPTLVCRGVRSILRATAGKSGDARQFNDARFPKEAIDELNEGSDQTAVQEWETEYAVDWRSFATDDTFEYRGHKVESLNLPRSVLKKLYHDNAVHWIPGIDANAR